jgi:hypothetical protein
MQGFYSNKMSESKWGMATFWCVETFEPEAVHAETVDLTKGWMDDAADPMIRKLIEEDPRLSQTMPVTTTVAQVLVLRPRRRHPQEEGGNQEWKSDDEEERGLVLVVNSHFYSHPAAPHVRLLQAYMVIDVVRRRILQYSTPGAREPAVIWCGDFNADASSGVCELLGRGCLEKGHEEWAEGAAFINVATKKGREAAWDQQLTPEDVRSVRGLFARMSVSLSSGADSSNDSSVVRVVERQTVLAMCSSLVTWEEQTAAAAIAAAVAAEILMPTSAAEMPTSAAGTSGAAAALRRAIEAEPGHEEGRARSHTGLRYVNFYAWMRELKARIHDPARNFAPVLKHLAATCTPCCPPDAPIPAKAASPQTGLALETSFCCAKLTHNLQLDSVYEGEHMPALTFYVPKRKAEGETDKSGADHEHEHKNGGAGAGGEVLDFIFFSRAQLRLRRLFPFFSKCEMDPGLPNSSLGSDHIAVVADLEELQ